MFTYLLNSGSFSRSNRAECVVIFEGLNSEISSSILRPIRLAGTHMSNMYSHHIYQNRVLVWKYNPNELTVFFHSLSLIRVLHSLLNPDPQLVVMSNKASGRTPPLWKLSTNMSPCRLESLVPSLFIRSGRCPKEGGCHPRARYMRRCLEVEMSHSDPRNTWLIFI